MVYMVCSCNNLVMRASLASLPQDVAEYTCARGFYLEYETENVKDIAPVGRTADFSFVWDGYDMISVMSRKVF